MAKKKKGHLHNLVVAEVKEEAPKAVAVEEEVPVEEEAPVKEEAPVEKEVKEIKVRPIEEKKRKNRKKDDEPKDGDGWYFARVSPFEVYIPPVFYLNKPRNLDHFEWFGPYRGFELAKMDICVRLQEKIDEIESVLKSVRKLKGSKHEEKREE